MVRFQEMNVKKADKIDEELVCADSFVHCLKKSIGHQQVEAQPEKDDPPDFWFIVDGKKYSAEITSIVKREDYHAHCRRFERAVQMTAKGDEIIKGTYSIIINKEPKLPKKTSREWHNLICKVCFFIQNSKTLNHTETEYLYKDAQGKLGIRKIDPVGASVGLLGLMGVKSEGQVQEEMTHLIHSRIRSKTKKLKKKGIPEVCSDIILIFYDAYGFGDIEDARQVLLRVDGYDWFHSVFWVASFTDRPNELWPECPGRYGNFLYSRERAWNENRSICCT